ncbi:MAG: sigma-54-dependent Fis family transcriptional regulator [Deltaproteobacteria bacterium]|nr:sigma-54-dependent Fis family transcriptional regulator [Deltaproteobacteria bacterium]
MRSKTLKILLVEDNPPDGRLLREMLADTAMKDSLSIVDAARLSGALDLLGKEPFDCVLLDLTLPDSHGLETFFMVKDWAPYVPVVVLTGLSDETMAARAVREGAQDYLVKGRVDGDILARSIRYAIERQAAARGTDKPAAGVAGSSADDEGAQYFKIIGTSRSIMEVKDIISTVARTSSTSVLIQGETGTGKGLVANAVHFFSNRRPHPFIKLNCSAIPDTLLEAEMFGYERGAFTDAKQSKRGLFELADRGTIFLDEIGDMDLRLQPKLLQALENRTFRKVGGVRDIRVDVRVVAATNKDLEAMVRERRFREDLYYRLKVMVIDIPPLRERKEDILPLAESFIREDNEAFGKNVKGLSPASIERLLGYSWPGNVRELKNVIERAMILTESEEIRPEHLSIEPSSKALATEAVRAHPYPEDMTLEEMEAAHIMKVLEKVKGNKTHASRVLGISRLTLREKLKKIAEPAS